MSKSADKRAICSFVVPCYNEQEVIPIFYQEIVKVLKELQQELEFFFIDDGSSDQSLAKIKELVELDDRIHFISFSRNFGKEAAIFAGLEASNGDYVVIMDVDLQDPPKLLPTMYQAVKEKEYDCVATRRGDRKGEPRIRSFFARLFYRIINKISKVEIVDGARDYRFMTRQMVDAIVSMKEYNRFSKGIFGWVGFKTKWIEFENIERAAGKTKWSFWKLFMYSMEGIVAFSTVPLAFVSFLGIIICILSLLGMLFIFIRTIVWSDPVSGWPSMICIITMLGGIQLLCLGIIGYYLSKTYLETKKRPIYIIKDKR